MCQLVAPLQGRDFEVATNDGEFAERAIEGLI